MPRKATTQRSAVGQISGFEFSVHLTWTGLTGTDVARQRPKRRPFRSQARLSFPTVKARPSSGQTPYLLMHRCYYEGPSSHVEIRAK
jgi:hypothetical protein